jgi:hypothetical protein
LIPNRLELIALATLHDADVLVPWLAAELRQLLGFPDVEITALPLRPEWLSEAQAGTDRFAAPLPRLLSNQVIDALVDRATDAGTSHHDRWALAVTSHDLAAPGRDYVFGEATLGGGWALISTARLAPATPDTATLRHRICVEALHELGHLAGLPHCSEPDCAMHPSVTPEDVDRKAPRFCAACQSAAAGAGNP